MPRVYTTLLKVTRIRLRISMTDCASLTSVCVAVADDAILTCSAEWPRAWPRERVQSSGRLAMVVVRGVGDGKDGIPHAHAATSAAFADLPLQTSARDVAARPCSPLRTPALRMDATSSHDLDALAVRCITDFLSPRQLAIATRTCHELCTACAGAPSRAHQAGRSEGPSASLLKRHAMPSP